MYFVLLADQKWHRHIKDVLIGAPSELSDSRAVAVIIVEDMTATGIVSWGCVHGRTRRSCFLSKLIHLICCRSITCCCLIC